MNVTVSLPEQNCVPSREQVAEVPSVFSLSSGRTAKPAEKSPQGEIQTLSISLGLLWRMITMWKNLQSHRINSPFSGGRGRLPIRQHRPKKPRDVSECQWRSKEIQRVWVLFWAVLCGRINRKTQLTWGRRCKPSPAGDTWRVCCCWNYAWWRFSRVSLHRRYRTGACDNSSPGHRSFQLWRIVENDGLGSSGGVQAS